MTNPVENAADIARRVLQGTYDPLLACRDLADLKNGLTEVSSDILDTFTAVSSELDGVPLGAERTYWAKEALALRDARRERYRAPGQRRDQGGTARASDGTRQGGFRVRRQTGLKTGLCRICASSGWLWRRHRKGPETVDCSRRPQAA